MIKTIIIHFYSSAYRHFRYKIHKPDELAWDSTIVGMSFNMALNFMTIVHLFLWAIGLFVNKWVYILIWVLPLVWQKIYVQRDYKDFLLAYKDEPSSYWGFMFVLYNVISHILCWATLILWVDSFF